MIQGRILSPHFYCIYTGDLFTLLRKKKTGCWVEGKFVGILGYADDLRLLSPSLDGLQEMIKSCGEHARSLNLSFSTNACLVLKHYDWRSHGTCLRIMLCIPRNSHRYFIEPLSDTKHITFSLFKRYIKFVDIIESSSKLVLKRMLRIVRRDYRSNTGKNLRKLMRIAGKTSIDDLKKGDFNDLIYNEIPEGEEWKIRLAEELIEMKNGIMDVKILTSDEINEILTYIVTIF